MYENLIESVERVVLIVFFSSDYGQFMAIPSKVLSGDFMNKLTHEASLQIETLSVIGSSHGGTRAPPS